MQDLATYNTAEVSASATSIVVNDVTAVSRGVIEIDDELIWVDDVNTQTGALSIPPYGRGFRGTVPAVHASGSRLVSSPLFPRKIVSDAINETVRSVYPSLFGVGEFTFNFTPAINTYALPAGALEVLQVSWQTVGPSKEWMPVRRMRVDKHASDAVFNTGVTVSIYDMIVPNRTVKIVYTKEPTAMSDASDEFSTVTGLPRSCEDLVRLGASYRLVPFFDTPHLSGSTAEADFAAQQRGVGQSAQLSRYLLQMYQVRLAEETKRLQTLYPIRSYYTR
jgi:hypothetical protein